MTVYTEARATAGAAIGQYGQSMTLVKKTTGAYSPSTGSASVTSASHTCVGAVFDYQNSMIDGSTILTGDKRVLLSAEGLTVTPDVGDAITIGGKVHSVINANPLAPAGVVVIWTIQARQ